MADIITEKNIDKLSSLRRRLANKEAKIAELQAEADKMKSEIFMLERGAAILAMESLIKKNKEFQTAFKEELMLLEGMTEKAIAKRLAAAEKEAQKEAAKASGATVGVRRGRPPNPANAALPSAGKAAA